MVLIKMISDYLENILILSEHVQILEQIFDSEVIRNYLYLSNLMSEKKEELYLKETSPTLMLGVGCWMSDSFAR